MSNITISYQEIAQKVELLVKDYMSKFDPSHDWLHVDRVRKMALKLGSSTSGLVDLEIIELGALLHDITDLKYVKAENAVNIKDLLISFGLDENRAALVDKLVSCVGYRKEVDYASTDKLDEFRENYVELHCVQDADKLDAIGAIGVLRCACFSGAKNVSLYNPKIGLDPSELATQSYGQHNSLGDAVSHFYDKLFKLKDMMRTDKGKSVALSRHNNMKLFIDQLLQEQAEF